MENELSGKTCVACHGGMAVLEPDVVADMMGQLHGDWTLAKDGRVMVRRVVVKGLNPPHHSDIRFGWNYCEVEFTTHVVHGLTENDFICAAKFDRILALG